MKLMAKKNKQVAFALRFAFFIAIVAALGIFLVLSKTEKTIFSPVESEFVRYKKEYNAKVGRHNDLSVWWISPEELNIINENAEGIVASISCNEDPFGNDEERYDSVLKSAALRVDEIMNMQGFQKNELNTSSSFDDEKFYDYVQAYEKGPLKCTFTASPDCGGMTSEDMNRTIIFSCTPDYDANYVNQSPYLSDLGIKDSVIHVSKKIGDFVYLNVNYRRTGHYVIAKLIDGKWTEVAAGQDIQSCDIIKKYQIPKEILQGCYDPTTEEILQNSL